MTEEQLHHAQRGVSRLLDDALGNRALERALFDSLSRHLRIRKQGAAALAKIFRTCLEEERLADIDQINRQLQKVHKMRMKRKITRKEEKIMVKFGDEEVSMSWKREDHTGSIQALGGKQKEAAVYWSVLETLRQERRFPTREEVCETLKSDDRWPEVKPRTVDTAYQEMSKATGWKLSGREADKWPFRSENSFDRE